MRNVIIILFALFTAGCSTGRITTTEDTKPDETIVFGKLIINTNRSDATQIGIYFNERLLGKYLVVLDSSGYFYTKLRLGENFVAMLDYWVSGVAHYYKNFAYDHVAINLTEAEKVYYIGDISVEWTPNNKDIRTSGMGGAIGGMATAVNESKKVDGYLPVSVVINDETIKYFNRLFPENKKEIITKPVTVNK